MIDNSVGADDVNIVDGALNGEATLDVSSVRPDLIVAALCGYRCPVGSDQVRRLLRRTRLIAFPGLLQMRCCTAIRRLAALCEDTTPLIMIPC